MAELYDHPRELSASSPGELSDLRRNAWFASLLLDSYRRLVGVGMCQPVWSSAADAAEWLYEDAPFGLLAHEASPDPLFVYANRTAQRCFGYTWEEFIDLPSRLSAAADAQQDREALLAAVDDRGYADGYRGLRRCKDGRTFWIEDVCMWNLMDPGGRRHGQAAVFRTWSPAVTSALTGRTRDSGTG